MDSLKEYIDSGILELHAAGVLSTEERLEVEYMADQHPEVRKALLEAHEAQQQLLDSVSVQPPASLKARVMAAIRQEKERPHAHIPHLQPGVTAADFQPWLLNVDSNPPDGFSGMFHVDLEADDNMHTALVWLEKYLDEEPHLHFSEHFYILEGSCVVEVDGNQVALKAGDYYAIPRFKRHVVHVTSACPCKFIVQRRAA